MAGVVMTADTKKFESGVKHAADAADKAGKRAGGSFAGVQGAFDRAAASAKKLAVAFAGLFASASAIKNIASAMTSTEQAISKLSAATADLSSARALFEDLNDLSREIPQSFDDITDAAVALNKAGIAPTHASLKSLAALAIGTNSSLAGVTSAISSAALGRTQGLKQLGIVAKDVGDGLEVTFKGVTEKIGKSGDDITAYVAKIADANFAQTLAIQMDGLTGAQKRLGEAWGDFWRAVAESGIGDLIKNEMNAATDALDKFTESVDHGMLGDVIENIKGAWTGIRDTLSEVFDDLSEAADSTAQAMEGFFEGAGDGILAKLTHVFKLATMTIRMLYGEIQGLFGALNVLGERIGSSLRDAMTGGTDRVMRDIDLKLAYKKMAKDRLASMTEAEKNAILDRMRISEKELLAMGEHAKTADSVRQYALMLGVTQKSLDDAKKRVDETRTRVGESNQNNVFYDMGAAIQESRDAVDKVFERIAGDNVKHLADKETKKLKHALKGVSKDVAETGTELERMLKAQGLLKSGAKSGGGSGSGGSGGGSAKESKINTAALDALKRQLQAAEDARKDAWTKEEEEYASRLAVLDEFHNNGILKEQEFGDLHAQVVEAHNAKITELMDAHYAEEREKRIEQQKQLEEIEKEFGFGTDTAISAFGDKLNKFGISWESFLTGMGDQSKMTMSQIAGVYSKGSAAVSSYFGSLASGLDQSSTEYKALFALQKGFAVASATMSVISGAAEAFKLGFPQGLVVMAQVLAQGMALVGQIKSINFSGAYDKGGVIPSGSVGLVGEYGPELISGPATVTSRKGTADAFRKSGDITVNVIEDASRAGQVSKEKTDEGEIINIVVANIRSGGGVSDAISTAYGLSRRGQ